MHPTSSPSASRATTFTIDNNMAPVYPKRKADMVAQSPVKALSKKRQTAQSKRRTQSVPGAFPVFPTKAPAKDVSKRSAHSVVASFIGKSPRPGEKSSGKPRTPSSNKQSSESSPQIKPPKCQRVNLRFSFGGAQDGKPLKRGRTRGRSRRQDFDQAIPESPQKQPLTQPTTPTRDQPTLRKSFSELVVTPQQHNLTGPLQREKIERSNSSPSIKGPAKAPDPSVFTKPTKKKEGYGFSYSESLWVDSDEYPDTECEWDLTDDKSSSAQTSPEMSLMEQDSSFDDVVVMRDVGSFHLARPQRILPCTRATREDTIRLKQSAKNLFKWDESEDVYAGLVERVERMVYAAIEKRRTEGGAPLPSVTNCSLKLRDFLVRVKDERIETGETRRFVEHEVEWAKWLVEASRTGVMHLKTKGCGCRPDWEED